MAHLRLVYKRAPTRHELEQQLDAIANQYGVSNDKKVFEQMLEVRRLASLSLLVLLRSRGVVIYTLTRD
jgi:hypothetical protein